jgi:hypothetical protein
LDFLLRTILLNIHPVRQDKPYVTENITMTYTRHNLPFFVFALLVLLSVTVCPAWIIDAGQSCTWGITNSDSPIPAGSIPIGAILTLHQVFMDSAASSQMLSLYLLHNPDPGLVKLAGNPSCDPFDGNGIPIGVFSQLTTPGQDLTVDLAQVNHPESQIRSVFPDSFTQTLGNQNTITYSSALLELLDYSGSGRSFGFGLYSQGFSCSAMTLQITVQSLIDASLPQILTYTIGNIHAPQLQFIPDYSISAGQTLGFTVTGSDEDGDTPLIYSVDNLPQGASLAGQGFTWTPSESQQGTWQIVFGVSDGALTDTQTVTITVQAAPAIWTRILYDDFESGMGNWVDGGTNCIRYVGSSYAHQGRGALDLQGNTSTSVATTNNLALSGYSKIKVEFWYKCISMDSKTEDFWLQISTNGGKSYTTVEEWNLNDEFVNGPFYQDSVTISGRTLTNQTRIRFRCDASAKDDDVYIDQITVSIQ